MNKESFLEAVKTQYAEEIREAYLECEHEESIDFTSLTEKLKKLLASAKAEGLTIKDFEDLVASNLPDTTAGRIDFLSETLKKAA